MNEFETIKLLLDHKFKFIEIVANTSMTWWVSSVAFCATIVGIALWRREAIQELPNRYLIPLGAIIHIFFISVILYGLLVINRVVHLKNDISLLVGELGFKSINYDAELDGVKWAVTNGTSSFFFIWLAWLLVTVYFYKCKKGQD